MLHEDLDMRRTILARLRNAGIAKIETERTSNAQLTVTIHTAKPGIVIGKGGSSVDQLREDLEKRFGNRVRISIQEIKQPELDAQLVAENIASQIERRISYKRAMKQAILRTMRSGAKGVRIYCGGRLRGAEMARREWDREGRVPLHTLRADIDFGRATSKTTFGAIGVKVWIYKDQISPAQRRLAAIQEETVPVAEAVAPQAELIGALAQPPAAPNEVATPHPAAQGATVAFGDFGLQAMEACWMSNRQIEAARRAMTRHVKRGGQIWIRVFPDKSITKKPAETRMGSGKGNPEGWVAVIKPGRVLFEMGGVTPQVAKEAMKLAAAKLPIKTRFVSSAESGGSR